MKQAWISIKTQLPEFGTPVLVCGKDADSVTVARLEAKTERKDSISCSWSFGYHVYDDVYHDITHWQPIELPDNQ